MTVPMKRASLAFLFLHSNSVSVSHNLTQIFIQDHIKAHGSDKALYTLQQCKLSVSLNYNIISTMYLSISQGLKRQDYNLIQGPAIDFRVHIQPLISHLKMKCETGLL